ncbi:MAG: TIGR01777 family oxidoreductase [Legionella sp.]|nr:TIGR01777 family oxidoreductase [Legionella sp.]
MNILIAGASGFIGQALVSALQKSHRLTVLGRDEEKLASLFPPAIQRVSWDNLSSLNANDINAVINLCGHNIAASRWNENIKEKIINSRIVPATTLINWALAQSAKPHFYNASAIGIYGMQEVNDEEIYAEDSYINYQKPRDFMSEIGIRWEEALKPAITAGLPVTITRFGVVLQKNDGMLKKLKPSFYAGLGSVMGHGKQTISWIQIDDLIEAYQFLLNNPKLTGVFNLTSPNPVTQAQFAKSLAKAMHRPLLLKTPAIVIRALFGEMGEDLILNGQRVVPKRLVENGFSFKFATLDSALTHEFN